MMIRSIVILGVLVSVAAASPGVTQIDPSRALANYRQLMAGQISWESLSPSEQRDLMALARAIRAQTLPKESDAERCWRTEIKRDGAATDLALRLIELRCGPRKS